MVRRLRSMIWMQAAAPGAEEACPAGAAAEREFVSSDFLASPELNFLN